MADRNSRAAALLGLAAIAIVALLGWVLWPRTGESGRRVTATTGEGATGGDPANPTPGEARPGPAGSGDVAASPSGGADPAPIPGPNDPEPGAAPVATDPARPDGADVLAASTADGPEQPVQLRWFKGDAWVVEVWLREMQTPQGGWSATPSRFRYRVTDETVFEGIECFEVTVDLLGQAGAEGGDEPVGDFRPEVFYVDRESYKLVGVFRHAREGGKWVKRTRRLADDPRPEMGSSAAGTSVPFDLPPAGALGEARSGTDAFTTFRFSEPGAPRPDAASLLGAGGDYTEVSFGSPRGGKVHQRWAAGDRRWPAESVSTRARSYRVR